MQSQLDYYTEVVALLKEELKFLQEYNNKQSLYRIYVDRFITDLQVARRQRALDLDLDVRRNNLETFRASRLHALQQKKKEQLEAEMKAQKELEERLKNRSSAIKNVVKSAVKATRELNKAMTNMIRKNALEMDDEEKRMAKLLRERNKEGAAARPECIKSLFLTYTNNEYITFEKQNQHLFQKGLPYFKPLNRSIGYQMFLWTQSTYDDSVFITDIVLSHKNPTNEHYKELTTKEYDELLTSDKLDLMIYIKRDKRRSKGVKALHLAYTEKDETDFAMKKYIRLEPNLGNSTQYDSCLYI
jgi:hypothetical protein